MSKEAASHFFSSFGSPSSDNTSLSISLSDSKPPEKTFKVLEIGTPENTEIINKYVAFGAQLFINIVKDEVDHITDIKEITALDCIGDNKGFDNVIRDVIERSLSG